MLKSALVLAQDMNKEGTDIGYRTQIRLTRALWHWRDTREQLVVAAGLNPTHPEQPQLMADMMHDWLVENGCTSIAVLRNAPLFNTEGEITAFFHPENDCWVGQRSSIISAPWHLIRAKDQVEAFYGRETVDSLNWVEVLENQMTPKDERWEPVKRKFFLATKRFSPRTRHFLWTFAQRTLRSIGINSSY